MRKGHRRCSRKSATTMHAGYVVCIYSFYCVYIYIYMIYMFTSLSLISFLFDMLQYLGSLLVQFFTMRVKSEVQSVGAKVWKKGPKWGFMCRACRSQPRWRDFWPDLIVLTGSVMISLRNGRECCWPLDHLWIWICWMLAEYVDFNRIQKLNTNIWKSTWNRDQPTE